MSARALLVLVVCAALGGGGCDGDDPPTTAGRAGIEAPRDLLVSAAEVRAQTGAGATVLGWWRALQTGDLDAASSAYAEPPKRVRLRAQLDRLADFLVRSRPRLTGERDAGRRRIVEIEIVSAALDSDGKPARIREAPVTLELLRARPGWALADNRVLEQLARLEPSSDEG